MFQALNLAFFPSASARNFFLFCLPFQYQLQSPQPIKRSAPKMRWHLLRTIVSGDGGRPRFAGRAIYRFRAFLPFSLVDKSSSLRAIFVHIFLANRFSHVYESERMRERQRSNKQKEKLLSIGKFAFLVCEIFIVSELVGWSEALRAKEKFDLIFSYSRNACVGATAAGSVSRLPFWRARKKPSGERKRESVTGST